MQLSISAQTVAPNWTYVSNVNANGVCFLTPLKGIAASIGGSQITTDGGQNWSPMIGLSGILYGVVAPSAQHVIGFSNTNIWTSFDGSSSFVSSASVEASSIFFLDDNHGWAGINNGNLLATIDGGSSWHMSNTSAPSNNITAVAFASTTNGVVGTNTGTLHYTTTGAGNYNFTASTIPAQLTSDYTISAIKWVNSTTVIATATSPNSQDAEILRSTDGGVTFTMVHSNSAEEITDVAFRTPNIGYAVGILMAPRNANGSALIYETTDAGQTWNQLTFNQNVNACDLYGITFLDSIHGWIAGFGCFYKYAPAVDTVSGISATSVPLATSLYPNPAQGTLHVVSGFADGQPCNYQITDIAGKTVLTGLMAKADFDITVNTLISGMYIVKLKSGDDAVVKKFMKE